MLVLVQEERKGWELADEEDRAGPLAHAYLSLRQVPAYERFINERFERCLDLYLCPRMRRKRVFMSDAKSLVPQLPKPRDLQPFPTALAMRFLGHTAPVTPPQFSLLPAVITFSTGGGLIGGFHSRCCALTGHTLTGCTEACRALLMSDSYIVHSPYLAGQLDARGLV